MSNFDFLPKDFAKIQTACQNAEKLIRDDPRASCFNARFALETLVHWMYRFDNSLRLPHETTLAKMLHDKAFRNAVPNKVFQKMKLIQKVGNVSAHDFEQDVLPRFALETVKELQHVCYWLTVSYKRGHLQGAIAWDMDKIPQAETAIPPETLENLTAQAEQLQAEQAKTAKLQAQADEADREIQALKAQLAEEKAQSSTQADPHDYNEADTRKHLIDIDLARAGWALNRENDKEYPVTGMPTASGKGYADYVLWGDDGKPLAVVEAKKTLRDAREGQQQAEKYADCLQAMHGQRPIIFYTNGYDIFLWDDANYPPRQVSGYYKKDELQSLIVRRTQKQALNSGIINADIAGRPYQTRAITSIFDHFQGQHRKALLVMATGTGKTRTSIALVDALQKSGWVKRTLFLADRVSLVNQAVNAFKAHLPSTSPVNLVTEKDGVGRVYACTYPTMMGLIDKKDGGISAFGVGHFDLIIIDEAHRSVYQKYRAIFEYFDSLLVGLTATPREEVDKNTYELFDLQHGMPTDAYELDTAVAQGYLVPPRAQTIDMQFPREGIDYDNLSDEDKARWDELEWDEEGDEAPDSVSYSAINQWFFNLDTVDKVLLHLMENGYTVESGDRLAKTIIFARNHQHALLIEERFSHHYPHYQGKFARVIDNYASYPQNLIDDFSNPEKSPQIAISVDMMDTGIDVPEVANLVFFKPVYSKIKFWQMIGRGTRLCPNLFGEGADKTDFRVFDFCFNFDFFKEKPDGITGGTQLPLSARLFTYRAELLKTLQQGDDDNVDLMASLTDQLFAEVSAMNPENFIVRRQLKTLEKYQSLEAWSALSDEKLTEICDKLAGLPSEIATDDIESRLFDVTGLQLQLTHVQGDGQAFEKLRRKVVDIATALEEKQNIPAIKNQLAYLSAIQNTEFWQDINLELLETLRVTLRELVPFIDKKRRSIIVTNFTDEITDIRDEAVIDLPSMTSPEYEKAVKTYLQEHIDQAAIQKLYTNQPITSEDKTTIEATLTQLGENDGDQLLSHLLAAKRASDVVILVRKIIGLDRAAAEAPFRAFIQNHSLNAKQIRFVEMIIDQLAENGVITAESLYEAPFTLIHSAGVDDLFNNEDAVLDRLFHRITETEPQVTNYSEIV